MNCQILASDIFDFAQLLVSHNVIQDGKSLYDVSSLLQCSKNENLWVYECENLKFSIEGALAGTIPHKISLVEIFLNITIEGVFSIEENVIKNPLNKLKFDIDLEGWNQDAETFYASWHLDKHIKSAQSTYIHPEYHFTFGGNKLEEKGVDFFGSTLILPSPRISYPPMDVILGIDFILQNYFSRDFIINLLDDSRYKEIVNNAIQRLWKPYYLSIVSAWDATSLNVCEAGFKHTNLNPHMQNV